MTARPDYLNPEECRKVRRLITDALWSTSQVRSRRRKIQRWYAVLMMRAYGNYDVQRGQYRDVLLNILRHIERARQEKKKCWSVESLARYLQARLDSRK